MYSLANLYRRIVWRIRKKFDLPRQTISPVQWAAPAHIEGPSSSFQAKASSEVQEKLEYLKREAELLSRLTKFFPSSLSDDDWSILIECANRKQRLDHFIFLRKREQLRHNEKKKRLIEKTRRSSEKVEVTLNNYLFNFNMSKIDFFIRQAEWTRVARSYELEGPKLAIDCRFLSQLSPRGADLTAVQLQHVITNNKQRKNPWPLYFVNFDSSNHRVNRLYEKHLSICSSSFTSGPILTSENYTSLADRSKIVYLSPHAEEDLSEVEDDVVYVIGGIVDRVPEKGVHPHASRVTAEGDGVRSLRLPLDKYVKWESGHKFLTLLAVMNILQDTYHSGGDWSSACQRHIPVRNIRPPAEKNQLIKTKHEQIREFNRELLRIVERQLGTRY